MQLSVTTSWAQNEPFPPLHDDGEPQLNDGQYCSKASFNVDIYTQKWNNKLIKIEMESSCNKIDKIKQLHINATLIQPKYKC